MCACRAIVAPGHAYQTGAIAPSSSSTVSDRIAYACHRRDAISHSNAKTGPGPVSFAIQSPPGFTLSGRVVGVKPGPRSKPNPVILHLGAKVRGGPDIAFDDPLLVWLGQERASVAIQVGGELAGKRDGLAGPNRP